MKSRSVPAGAAVAGIDVVVLGHDTREALFQDASGIGLVVHLNGIPFGMVVGGIASVALIMAVNTAFVASSDAVIDIFDTWCYQKVASVAIRDPIIGPVRASVRPNGQLVLVGATIRGVTLVALPDTFTTTCQ